MAAVGLVHATPLAIPPVREAFARLWPDARLINLLDEGLLAVLESDGSIGPRATDHMLRVVGLVRDSGVGVIQLTCSAYSPLVPTLRQIASVPVLAIDDVLVETAVARGRRIGLISTQPLTAAALRAAAERAGRAIDLDAIVYREAFEALGRGDGAEHDRLLGEKIAAYADREVIVLGQASMARVLPTLPPELAARTLTSPTLAVETARQALDGR
jgi:Asp/Glu/hydantoin racemase